MTYYKAVAELKGKLWSSSVAILPLDWGVEYIPGEWVSGKAPLWIINGDIISLESVIDRYYNRGGLWQLWRIEADNPRKPVAMADPFIHSPLSYGVHLEEFWKHPEDYVEKSFCMWPTDWICDRVKLVERVDQ